MIGWSGDTSNRISQLAVVFFWTDGCGKPQVAEVDMKRLKFQVDDFHSFVMSLWPLSSSLLVLCSAINSFVARTSPVLLRHGANTGVSRFVFKRCKRSKVSQRRTSQSGRFWRGYSITYRGMKWYNNRHWELEQSTEWDLVLPVQHEIVRYWLMHFGWSSILCLDASTLWVSETRCRAKQHPNNSTIVVPYQEHWADCQSLSYSHSMKTVLQAESQKTLQMHRSWHFSPHIPTIWKATFHHSTSARTA